MRSNFKWLLVAACVALLLPHQAPSQAYLTDGTKGISGGVNTPSATTYSNPNDGICVVGVKPDGTLLVDPAVANLQDCNVWTKNAALGAGFDLTGMTTQATCTTGNGLSGNDGAKHKWVAGGTNGLCVIGSTPKSRAYLDVNVNMCTALGGTIQATGGTCVAFGWTYQNSKAGEAIPYRGTVIPTTGRADADKLGFCYAQMRMTTAFSGAMALPVTASTCPAVHNAGIVTSGGGTTTATISAGSTTLTLSNALSTSIAANWSVTIAGAGAAGVPFTAQVVSVTTPGQVFVLNSAPATSVTGANIVAYAVSSEWPLGTDGMPYQNKASYDAGLGWSFSGGQCLYTYGRKGIVNAAMTKADGTVFAAAASSVDLTTISTQGVCLADGGNWDAWLPYDAANPSTPGATTVTIPTTPSSSTIVKLDATTPVLTPGGGDFYSSTGAVCEKCHSDQSRATIERWKPGFGLTAHKLAGDDPAIQAAIGPTWGIKGVQCTICHATGKPGQQDVGVIVYPNTTGANAGLPRSASGHNQTVYGSHLTGVCYFCHGAPNGANRTVDGTGNPAAVIPVSGGEFASTTVNGVSIGLAPIANQFLASPHAKYGEPVGSHATSRTVDVITRTNYASTFEGWVCRDSAFVGVGTILTTYVKAGVPTKIPNPDSLLNPACTNSPSDPVSPGAGGNWVRDGSATSTSNGVAVVSSDQGNCMTCHDVHWSKDDANTYGPYKPEPFRRECTTCHSNLGTSASGAPQVNIATIKHPSGAGTPLAFADDNEKCETCHMPKLTAAGSKMHLWKVSTNAAYQTVPSGATQAAADSDGLIKLDVNLVCGQCHKAGGTAPFLNTAQLAAAALDIHTSGGSLPVAAFTAKNDSVNPDQINVVPNVTCPSGQTCTNSWDWGDGSADTTGGSQSHLYAADGNYVITLTVSASPSLGEASSSQRVTAYSNVNKPTAAGNCTFDAPSWVLTCTDASTPGSGTLVQTVIDWGDGTVLGKTVPYTHMYLVPGVYHVTLKTMNSYGLSAMAEIATVGSGPSAIVYGTLHGHAFTTDGITGLPAVQLQIARQSTGTVVATLMTDADGSYTITLRPDTYTVTAMKFGTTFSNTAPFADPATVVVLGNGTVTQDFKAQ